MLDGLNIDPVAFTIPIGDGFSIHWYGIIIVVGIAVGAIWAGREVQRRSGDIDEFYNGLIVVIFSGFFFARLWYVLQEIVAGRGDRFQTLLDVINVRAGGLNILGGFIGAAVVSFFYIRWRKADFWLYADVAGPALLIAQAIGRWGNFINQELYGPPTSLSWGILIDADRRIPPYNDLSAFPADTRFHPTFLYESLWLLIGFILLVAIIRRYRNRLRSGTIFGLFLLWWGGGRAWIELFRPDQPAVGGSPVTYSMILALLIAAGGVLLVLVRNDKWPQSAAARRRRRRRVRKPQPQRRETPL
ncbi:MAG: prolipoprotein diacylglyceryl transferase [Candidatus Promineifilaceae bacterium]